MSLQSSLTNCLNSYMSSTMRKPDFFICQNKDTNQLRSNCSADQRLCFRYIESTIPLLLKSKISCLQPSSVAVQTSLCRIWLETLKTVFLTTRSAHISLWHTICGPSIGKLYTDPEQMPHVAVSDSDLQFDCTGLNSIKC